ncbi:hypothetical protein [Streptomyces pseudovenezuelae]|uniref:Uncharacterized protein n=1 Tax=Streptomyces pseudovenezuelae TaxID=67350 RepID=A0ABT6LE88_9ACTN|nr:hypothetical protein [Streptomyces pseudovenezuelae]MDH6214099.1 hypothetical protein [Streptomyces pseudovenezuelae]
MSLTPVVTLALVITSVVLAYRDEKLGAALMTGCAVLAALYALLGAPAAGAAPQAPAPTSVTESPVQPG